MLRTDMRKIRGGSAYIKCCYDHTVVVSDADIVDFYAEIFRIDYATYFLAKCRFAIYKNYYKLHLLND